METDDKFLLALFGFFLILSIVFWEDNAYNFNFLKRPANYTEDDVARMEVWLQECGVNVSGVGVKVKPLEEVHEDLSNYDDVYLSEARAYSYSWRLNEKVVRGVVFSEEVAYDNNVIAHEMAHQALFEEGYHKGQDQHGMTEFTQWEMCLTFSRALNFNLCRLAGMRNGGA